MIFILKYWKTRPPVHLNGKNGVRTPKFRWTLFRWTRPPFELRFFERCIAAMGELFLAEKTKLFEAIKAVDLPPILKKLVICRYVVSHRQLARSRAGKTRHVRLTPKTQNENTKRVEMPALTFAREFDKERI